jgi:hypothetical protein
MAEKTVEIRGNHLIPLYSQYNMFLDRKNGKGVSYEAHNYLDKLSIDKYGEDFTMHSKNLYFHLFNNPEQKVKIINGDDILCKRCPLKGNGCENNPSYEIRIAQGFGLEINKEYTMEDIAKKLENEGKEFYERNSALFTLNSLISLSAKN